MGYILSKCAQEEVLTKFLEEHKDENGTEIVTLHPSFIIGPALNAISSSSIDGVKKLVDGLPAVPQLSLSYVDVRDVA